MCDISTLMLNISYATKTRKYVSSHMYQNISVDATLRPVRIIRTPCGSGAAAHRYYYSAQFPAPDDAEFILDGLINENINRKMNPHFNPKKINWEGNASST